MRPSLAAVLLSSLLAPVVAHASDVPVSAQPLRITTGVIAPVLLNPHNYSLSADAVDFKRNPNPTVVLALKVDEKGAPQDIHIMKSVNSKVDAEVLEAVREFRYRPAMLDNQPVSVDLELTVLLQR